jgi:SAM-dependent methyltransferase
MDRIVFIQELFKRTAFTNYLEIGCRTGASFLPIKAAKKTAVDPVFKVPMVQKLKWLFKEPKNLGNRYFEEASDTFFERRKPYLQKLGTLDVVLVDGLHSFRAALSDVLNALAYLRPDGIIVMHDCFPPNKIAALSLDDFEAHYAKHRTDGRKGMWNGDVWKAIVYLRECHSNLLDVCVIDTDSGLGIVRFKNGNGAQQLDIDESVFARIDAMAYEDLMADHQNLLNLKPVAYADTILDEYK